MWLVVNHKWNLRDINCNDIGATPTHRMYPIAGFLMHEIIHFRSFTVFAFGNTHTIDDEPGTVPQTFTKKGKVSSYWPAYGPWQARNLASHADKHESAWRNVDNFTAFAMEVYWYHHCRLDQPHHGAHFDAPSRADWPLNCAKAIKQATCIVI